MAEKVAKVGIKKQKGFLYFVDKQGDISCAVLSVGRKRKRGTKKVAKVGVKKNKAYLYFVDKKGDVCRAKLQVGGRKRKRR